MLVSTIVMAISMSMPIDGDDEMDGGGVVPQDDILL